MSSHSLGSSQVNYHTFDLSISLQMGRVHRICRDAVTAAVEPLGLTQSRWTALVHIDYLSEGVTQLELAQSLGIEMPSLTRTLKQLEEQALIIRKTGEEDKRSKHIYFTEKGRALLDQLQVLLIDIKEKLYGSLSHQQMQLMASGLVEIEANARKLINDLTPINESTQSKV
ncbi:MarR family transcriptional regulator [Catenovulum sp. 2E275]|uniref:MarR family transcriptional regulator n=1 Tax=Catenovulum sp. 2E275 TaxID=2980497 RepID=UPI0021CE5DC9|nr:MarR family transcriptional regulator [Catenovulum sp. 2E275]MCU4675688.1 MarR family transcriptional regulator [Catenovulum sp. 2E275]